MAKAVQTRAQDTSKEPKIATCRKENLLKTGPFAKPMSAVAD